MSDRGTITTNSFIHIRKPSRYILFFLYFHLHRGLGVCYKNYQKKKGGVGRKDLIKKGKGGGEEGRGGEDEISTIGQAVFLYAWRVLLPPHSRKNK